MPGCKVRRRSMDTPGLRWGLYHPLEITPLRCSHTNSWSVEQCSSMGVHYFYDSSAPKCHEPGDMAYGLIAICKNHFRLFIEDQKDSLRKCTIDLVDENEFLIEAVMIV